MTPAEVRKLKPGTRVSCEVVWKDGRTTMSEGSLICVNGDKAYVELVLGPVEADIETVEPAE